MSDDWNAKLEKLLKETEELKARISALEPKAKAEFKVEPVLKRWDPTEGMSMDRATMAEFAAAASGGGIANDSWRSTQPSSIIPKAEVPKAEEPKVVQSQRGWVDPAPLGPPEGQRWVDMQLDAQAALDKRELEKKLGVRPSEDGGKDA